MWYFWEYDIIDSNSQPRLGTRKVNGSRKFSEIKFQKTWVLMFAIAWNFARSFRKTYCVQQCKKMVIGNLILVTLSCIVQKLSVPLPWKAFWVEPHLSGNSSSALHTFLTLPLPLSETFHVGGVFISLSELKADWRQVSCVD